MPPFTGYGSYSGLAGALDGLGQFLRGRREDQELERQRKRQDAADADAAVARRVGMALTKAQLHSAGIREGAAPSAGFAVPGLTDGALTQVQDPTRYTDLGEGFYLDRNQTPEFRKGQQERVAATTAANAEEQKRLLIGQALQDPNPRDAIRRLLSAGVSADDAPKLLDAVNPTAKAPVPGTEAYYAMKEREAQIGAKYRGGSGGSGGAGGPMGARGPNGQPAPVETTELMKWRSEFDKQTAPEREIASAFSRLQGIAKKGAANMSATDDVALIFSYMKMLDPGSVVREGEFATAQQTTGIPGQILNYYNRALSGERLGAKQRTEMLATAQQIAQAANERVRSMVTRDVPTLTARGINPSEVMKSPFSGLLTGREVSIQDELTLAREALRDGEPYAVVARTFRERTGQELPR